MTERRGDAGKVRILLGGETHRPTFHSRNHKSEEKTDQSVFGNASANSSTYENRAMGIEELLSTKAAKYTEG